MQVSRHHSIVASFYSPLGCRIIQSRPLGTKTLLPKAQNRPKSRPEGFKIHPKSVSDAIMLPRTSSYLLCFRKILILNQFLDPQMEPTSTPKRYKIDSKKSFRFGFVFLSIFIEKMFIFGPTNNIRSNIFRLKRDNIDFMKNLVFIG